MEQHDVANASLSDSYKEHLIPFYPGSNPYPAFVQGIGAKVRDDKGKWYIDLEAGPGVTGVGHCHPKLVSAIVEQAKQLIHSPGRYVSRLQLSLAQRLSGLTGGKLEKTFFASTGAEATEGAIKLALKYAVSVGKKNFGIIALQHGFHGRLSLSTALTGIAKRKKGLATFATFPGVVHALAPYCYRCPLGLSYPSCGAKCADSILDLLQTSIQGDAAALIIEPVFGTGGLINLPDEYWKKIRKICDDNEILLIADEVFTGFGRTGKFFAYQNPNVVPDILCFAKAIGGGIPLGGFIAKREIADAFESGDHSTTMGSSNQLGLAAGHAVLDILQEENLVARAEKAGDVFMSSLKLLQKQISFIGDVRGRGLMIGIEVVTDQEKREPAPKLTSVLLQDLLQSGLLMSISGVFGNVLRITPPLVISDAEIAECLEKIEATFRRHSGHPST